MFSRALRHIRVNTQISPLSNQTTMFCCTRFFSACSTGTSPVEVPSTNSGAHQRARRKTDSVSSVGSWQMVSACGSLRSPDFHWTQLNAKSPNNKNANVSPTVSYASSGGGSGGVHSENDLDALYKK